MSNQTEVQEVNINFDPVLEYFKDHKNLFKLEKTIEVFLADTSFNFAELLAINFPSEIANGLFPYIISADKIEASQINKSFRETISKINLFKDLYGPLIIGSFKKQFEPFMVQRIAFSGIENSPISNMTIKRNDGENLSVQVDFNITLQMGIQVFGMINTLYDQGENNIDTDKLKEFLNSIMSFVTKVTQQPEEID